MEKLPIVKQDINFLDKPLWFQDCRNSGLGFVWKDIDGYEYRTSYKLPDKVDALILLYLLMKSQRFNYTDKLELSRYEILKECGFLKNNREQYYDRLEDSLKRWHNVSISFKGTFYDGNKYIAIGFHIIDSYKINEETKNIEIVFNEDWLCKIKESSFFKYISFEQYKALKRPISRRLFEILCKTFKERDTWSIHLTKLGTKLTIYGRTIETKSESKTIIYASDVLVAIKPAINEINKLFQTSEGAKTFNIHPDDMFTISYTITGEKQERIIHFTKNPIKIEKNKISQQSDELSQELYNLVLIEHREKKTIRTLIDDYRKKHSVDYVKRNIFYANQNAKKNYRAFFERCLKNDWGFGLNEDQESQQKIKDAEVNIQAAEDQKRKEEFLKLEIEKQETMKYLSDFSRLPESEQERLRQLFIQELSNDYLRIKIRKSGIKSVYDKILFKDFLKKLNPI
jgi:hypothetical protein